MSLSDPANPPPEPAKDTARSSTFAWFRRAIIIGVLGGLLFAGWYVLQPLIPSIMPLGAGFTLLGGGDRIGRPAVAPVLRQCTGNIIALDLNTSAEPSALYAGMTSSSLFVGGRAVLGSPDAEAMATLAVRWGQLANCIYAKEARTLCDLDNRAIAVATLVKFLLHEKQANQSLQKLGRAASANETRTIEALKSRALSALRAHRRDGIFIASDFGFFAPSEIRHIIGDQQSTRNVCGV